MHFTACQKRWVSLILTVLISAAGIQLEYLQGYAFLAYPGARNVPANAVSRATVLFMESGVVAETPRWRSLQNVARAERARRSGPCRGMFPDCYCSKVFSGMYTRIYLPSRRIENVFARSHALIMQYIHCQDGMKADNLFCTNRQLTNCDKRLEEKPEDSKK